jgi:hypothetical protein
LAILLSDRNKSQPNVKASRKEELGENAGLFDHFVGAGEQGGRDFEAQIFCSFEVDH